VAANDYVAYNHDYPLNYFVASRCLHRETLAVARGGETISSSGWGLIRAKTALAMTQDVECLLRILAVDPGSKRIGLAVSDPTGTIASPLMVILHIARLVDAAAVAEQATVHAAGLIVVGQSLDEEGNPTFEGRQSARFAEVLKMQTAVPVVLWDESFTTQEARAARIEMGVTRKKRSGHLDDFAAAALLQSYLDANRQSNRQSPPGTTS
jgi:putative Holliday junction resolvase